MGKNLFLLNHNILLNISHRHLNFGMIVENINMEGTISQIFMFAIVYIFRQIINFAKLFKKFPVSIVS